MKYYLIDEVDLEVLKGVAKRLYSENRLSGDAMRDLAQRLDEIVNNAHAFVEAVQ